LFDLEKILFFPFLKLFIAYLHDQNKSGFFRGPVLFQPIRLFENFLDCSDWMDKSRPSKKSPFCFDHVNWLLITFDWLEKCLDRKQAPIEVIISLFT